MPVFSATYKSISEKFDENYRFLQEQIDDYKTKFEAPGHVADSEPLPFVGAYLKAKREAEHKGQVGAALFRCVLQPSVAS